MRNLLIIDFFLIIFFIPSFLISDSSENTIEIKEEFKIIKGIGKPPTNIELTTTQKLLMARRAAIIDAYRNALIYLKKYNKKRWDIKPYQTIHISGKIKGSKIIDTIYEKDGCVEVKIKITKKKR